MPTNLNFAVTAHEFVFDIGLIPFKTAGRTGPAADRRIKNMEGIFRLLSVRTLDVSRLAMGEYCMMRKGLLVQSLVGGIFWLGIVTPGSTKCTTT